MAEETDAELLSLFAHEESRERGFALLVSKYSVKIYWTVRKIVVSHHDADDVVQNVFLKLWTVLPTFRGDSGLYTWIYRIAVNESLSLLRKRRTSLFATANDTTLQLEQLFEQERFADGDVITQAVDRAILRLPNKQRIVFNMRYYDEIPYEEMSQILGTSVGALKASYHHAYQKVQESLRQENFLDPD